MGKGNELALIKKMSVYVGRENRVVFVVMGERVLH